MKTTKLLLRRPIVTVSILIISAISITMFISDNYYSNLENEYPLLTNNEQINVIITSFKDHHNYTYIEVDFSIKRLIRPTNNTDYNPPSFNDFIAIGDKIIHEKWSKRIEIVKNNKSYNFDLIETYN